MPIKANKNHAGLYSKTEAKKMTKATKIKQAYERLCHKIWRNNFFELL